MQIISFQIIRHRKAMPMQIILSMKHRDVSEEAPQKKNECRSWIFHGQVSSELATPTYVPII
jgi:hypothetical protein